MRKQQNVLSWLVIYKNKRQTTSFNHIVISHLKVGEGAGFEEHFSNEKGHLKFFSRKCWRRGEEVISKNFPEISELTQSHVSGICFINWRIH
jgi:hypothetical protein